MPVPVPELGSYQYVPETKENLDWADLVTIDLSLYDTQEGKKQLASTLISALREKGFFYVKNFNISQERVNRQFALGREFYELPLEEKLKYKVEGLEQGKFNGYVPAGRRVLSEKYGIKDKVEVYNIPKFNGFFEHNHPAIIEQNIAEVEEFALSLHSEVLDPLFVLLAIALELPEDHFTKIHQYPVKSEDHLRYMKYGKHSPEDNSRLDHWGGGHTDLGSFTLLFRQPVTALQIRYHSTNEWKWVKPQDATLTVNACDALQFLTGGYVKSTIHRVTVPPKDQQHVDRLGLLYFSRPHNDIRLETIKDSPVLQREGYTQNVFEASGNPVPTMEEWTFAKQKWQRTTGYTDDIKHRTASILPGYNEKSWAVSRCQSTAIKPSPLDSGDLVGQQWISLGFLLQRAIEAVGPADANQYFKDVGSATELTKFVCVNFQILVADLMLTYRCWVIHKKSWRMAAVPILLWIGVFIASTLMLVTLGQTHEEWLVAAKSVRLTVTFFWVTSITLNFITTLLIVWRLYRGVKNCETCALVDFQGKNGNTLSKVIMIIVESGILYTTASILTCVTYVIGSRWVYVSSAIELQSVGIAFNLIIIRVSMAAHSEISSDINTVATQNASRLHEFGGVLVTKVSEIYR
ncbi:flavonol synthase [Moniliophthora roreri]|nr:flavonol synthase [Moniliophthora roreri]